MMGWLRDVKAGLKGYAFESLVTRAAFVHFKRPVVTLTFDDVPRTALIDGLPILARRGVKSTFYVAMGLNAEEPGSFLNEVDVRYLAAEGHEIGCHTWSHYRLSEHQGNASGLAADATRNRDRLLEFTDGRYPRNFSFPYGEVTFGAKRRLEADYSSLRSTHAGVNGGRIDLNCLRAISVCRAHRDDERVEKALETACAQGAWVILYTHGVSDRYDSDSTAEHLESVLAACAAAGAEFCTVDEVVGRLSA